MIDNIDLSHWSVSQLCQFHNSVIRSGCNINGHWPSSHPFFGYNDYYDENDQVINQVKQTLIDMGACSKYVLDYRGQL